MKNIEQAPKEEKDTYDIQKKDPHEEAQDRKNLEEVRLNQEILRQRTVQFDKTFEAKEKLEEKLRKARRDLADSLGMTPEEMQEKAKKTEINKEEQTQEKKKSWWSRLFGNEK